MASKLETLDRDVATAARVLQAALTEARSRPVYASDDATADHAARQRGDIARATRMPPAPVAATLQEANASRELLGFAGMLPRERHVGPAYKRCDYARQGLWARARQTSVTLSPR